MQKSIQKTIRLDSYVFNLINNYKDGDSFNAKLENLIKFSNSNLDKLESDRVNLMIKIEYESDKLRALQEIYSDYDYLNQELLYISKRLNSLLDKINHLEVLIDE